MLESIQYSVDIYLVLLNYKFLSSIPHHLFEIGSHKGFFRYSWFDEMSFQRFYKT